MFQAFHVLRYEIGQKYNSHYDAFDPAVYGPQKSQRVQAAQKYIISFSTYSFLVIGFGFFIAYMHIEFHFQHTVSYWLDLFLLSVLAYKD